MTTDLKTTVTGIVTGIISTLGYFGVAGIPEWVAPLAITVGVTLIGVFAKDAPKAS